MAKSQSFTEVLKAYIAKAGSQRLAAEALDISESFICDILKGRKPVPNTLAEKLGYKWTLTRIKS